MKPASRSVAAIRSGMVVILMTLGFGAVGFLGGDVLGYGIARITRRDPAELKDMLIWCFIATPIMFAATGFWLAVRKLTERIWLRRFAISIFLVVAVCSAAIIILSYIEAPRYN